MRANDRVIFQTNLVRLKFWMKLCCVFEQPSAMLPSVHCHHLLGPSFHILWSMNFCFRHHSVVVIYRSGRMTLNPSTTSSILNGTGCHLCLCRKLGKSTWRFSPFLLSYLFLSQIWRTNLLDRDSLLHVRNSSVSKLLKLPFISFK